MRLEGGIHLAYCTNIHPGEGWRETLASLENYTLAVRERVQPRGPYAIGLRLGEPAARELSDPSVLTAFQRWLDRHDCYVFTINGFPYGRFHGAKVKEQVYRPDWTTRERLEYTNLLFDLLAELTPPGVDGSVSTVPGTFLDFIGSEEDELAMRDNLWQCVEHIAAVSERKGKRLHLGLEPEPMCYLQTSEDMARFYDQMRSDRPRDARLEQHLGVTYDTCHLAVQFEEPASVVDRFRRNRLPISKIHLSSALAVTPTEQNRNALKAFADDTYLHQVVHPLPGGGSARYRDLDAALREADARGTEAEEWRIHFHIPLHAKPTELFRPTTDHLLGLLDLLQDDPDLCDHFEMETYTWGVMPTELRERNVVDQLASEYDWTLARFAERGFEAQP